MAVPVQVRERVGFQKDIYSVLKDLDAQRITGELCDITLKVNGRCFHAHRAVLGATSPYFRSMFTSCMREQHSEEVDLTASLNLEHPDSFKHILDYVYSGEIEINVTNAEDMLRIADFLLFEDVKDYCKQFYLQHGNLNIGNCLVLSELADQHNLPEVAYVARRMLKSRFHDHFIKSDEMNDLPETVFLHMLENKEMTHHIVDTDLLLCIICWIKHDLYSRANCMKRLFSRIAFNWLDHIKLTECIYANEQKTKSDLMLMIHGMKFAHQNEHNRMLEMAKIVQSSCDDKNTTPSSGEPSPVAKPSTLPVLIAANSNSALKYAKIIIFDILNNLWRHIPHSEHLMSVIPTRLNVCSWVQKGDFIYMFLSYNLPYPTDLHRITVLVMDIKHGEFTTHTFSHCYNTGECCKTSLTDDRSVPPVIVHCSDHICIVGNMEGNGHIFICDFETNTYNCFQIPGTRFVSLARAVVKHDQFIYIWCRHRYGHEEYCINKDTTFVRFDIVSKSFHNIPTPPGIGYGEYSDTHALCLKDDTVQVHSPGKSSFVLDESLNQWIKQSKSLPCYTGQKTPVEMPYHGYELYTHSGDKMYILQNPTAYTTNMTCLTESDATEISLVPPPVDGVSLVIPANLETSFVSSLPLCDKFDETYTHLIHNRTFPVDYDTSEDSVNGGDSDSEDGYEYDDYEYDDAIYGYFDDFDF